MLAHSMAGWSDIARAFRYIRLISVLAWQDVAQRYRRSSIGVFWLTISMGTMVATIGLVFGRIFGTPMHEFLPFLSAGLIIWGLISSTVSESCNAFIAAEGIIKQLNIPLSVHVARVIWRNLIVFAHNLVILPVVFLLFGSSVTSLALEAIPGLLLLILNLGWVSLILAVISTRFRDLPQFVNNALQILFFLSPIAWMPRDLAKSGGTWIMEVNPVYHLLEIVRGPIIGVAPSAMNWIVAIVMAIFGWALAILIYGRLRRRIAYWL